MLLLKIYFISEKSPKKEGLSLLVANKVFLAPKKLR